MKWTFGIITTEGNEENLNKVLISIWNQRIPQNNYEIIVVGGKSINGPQLIHIPFDETIKPAWITKKKQIIAESARFDNLAIVHDYVSLDKDWYKNFLIFVEDWSHCVCRIEHQNGVRGRDWVTWDTTLPMNSNGTPHSKTIRYIDYNDVSQTKNQYISGQCYCIKKEFALNFPLDENKSWGQSEDVANSLWVRPYWNLKINAKSIFRYVKPKDEDYPWPPRTIEYNFKQNGIDR